MRAALDILIALMVAVVKGWLVIKTGGWEGFLETDKVEREVYRRASQEFNDRRYLWLYSLQPMDLQIRALSFKLNSAM